LISEKGPSAKLSERILSASEGAALLTTGWKKGESWRLLLIRANGA